VIRRLYAECIITSNQEKASLTVDVSAPFLCHVIRVIVAAPDATNRRVYPPYKPFASKENTSADPIIVPGLYRRGGALSWRHHA
jgi:hypothetical protein